VSSKAQQDKKPNRLIHESSPYLLQHAYNPVDWLPFGEEAFQKAKSENKPMLISVGYSACHWCHVMEHESFEDQTVAELMNRNFINVKVDREERSDVDMLYMTAVQLMTGHGGWPMNCFVLPDGRPFYGGTYFPRQQWLNILGNLSDLYRNEPERVEAYAGELTNGIKQSELIAISGRNEAKVNRELLKACITKWKRNLDNKFGGPDKAPKFPLPSNYRFLLRYALLEKDERLLEHVHLTLRQMAFGGIYDQVHGGFARYSTDVLWKVPHFEKMLYDNAQLADLFSEAYVLTKNELYKEIALDTLNFVEREWYQAAGFFYSAYDADSEGVEGKYYVWSQEELKELLGDTYEIFARYFEVNEKGYWEDGNYILMRSDNTALLLSEFGLNTKELKQVITDCISVLRKEAKNRVKPGLDDKTISSWNALMCSAFAKAFLSFGEQKHKNIALSSINFLINSQTQHNGRLFRIHKNGRSTIEGFLDDYAFTIEALINCYLISHEEHYLTKAGELCSLTLEEFKNTESDFLFYTGKHSSSLVSTTTEVSDNVIPASNSQMAVNLFNLGNYLGKEAWTKRALRMLEKVSGDLKDYGAGYSNWACLALHYTYPFRELAIVGKNVDEKFIELYQEGLINTIFAVSDKPSEMPLLMNRFVPEKTLYYVCENHSCKEPVSTIEDVLKQLD
jgi:uncharacterized protein